MAALVVGAAVSITVPEQFLASTGGLRHQLRRWFDPIAGTN